MYTAAKHYFLLLVFTILSFAVRATGFNASPTQGCAPLQVSFTPTVSGTGHYWTFGNGNSSTQSNPSAFFANPGVYTVTLVLNVNGLSQTHSLNIIVFPSPTAGFYAAGGTNTGCTDLTVQFYDNSSPSSTITNYEWNYGDGSYQNFTTSTNPTHVYTIAGTFPVNLKVTDSNGCTDEDFQAGLVQASPGPEISFFSLSGTNFCELPVI